MPGWAAFAGLTGATLVALLVLARISQPVVTGSSPTPLDERRAPADAVPGEIDGTDGTDGTAAAETRPGDSGHEPAASGAARRVEPSPVVRTTDGTTIPTGVLLANVALSQGIFGALLAAGAWFLEIPPAALGVTAAPSSAGLPAVVAGVGLGTGLYVAGEIGAAVADALGIQTPEELRELLAPETPLGWVLLLAGVLPVIAGVEEFLFRAAVVGAISAGFGVSPWLLAVVSSIAFAFGHGAQGPAGIAVTGVLGFVLAAAFVLTGSLLTVVVAHYLVNALEFVVHEGLGVEWP